MLEPSWTRELQVVRKGLGPSVHPAAQEIRRQIVPPKVPRQKLKWPINGHVRQAARRLHEVPLRRDLAAIPVEQRVECYPKRFLSDGKEMRNGQVVKAGPASTSFREGPYALDSMPGS